MDAGADVNASDNDGSTALLYAAAERGTVQKLRELLDAGADVHARDNSRQTALMNVARFGTSESMKVLLDAGADVDARNKENWTAYDIANNIMHFGHEDSESQIDLWHKMSLLRAASSSDTRVQFLKCTKLCDFGFWKDSTKFEIAHEISKSNVHARSNSAKTALMFAAFSGTPQNIMELLARGSDIHARSDDGRTALMWAAWWGNSDNVKVLIDAGADVTARDKDGETPLQILEKKYEDSEKSDDYWRMRDLLWTE